MVKITMKGTKDVSSVEMKVDQLEKEDMEMLEEMIKSAINDANKKIDDATEKKMGKFGNIPGLF
jgi:DNA-binding protein YbaB